MKTKSQWWEQTTPNHILSGAKIIEHWQLELFGQGGASASALQSLSDRTAQLWNKFNTSRTELDRDYMSDEKMLSAYLASFLIPNIERCRFAVSQSGISNKIASFLDQDEICILDFGSGPLSASIGILIAIGSATRDDAGFEPKLRRITIHAVERSEKAVTRGTKLLSSALNGQISLEIQQSTSIPKNKFFHIVAAANVFNEIPEKHRLKTLQQLSAQLRPNDANFALILEPGQEQHAKNLSGLRDNFIAADARKEFKIIAPCLHDKPCPLSANSGRSDWCWFRINFNPPFLQNAIDSKTRIQHKELAFSYFSFGIGGQPNGHSVGNTPWAVCVSDEMPTGNPDDAEKRHTYFRNNLKQTNTKPGTDEQLAQISRTGCKTKLCCNSGEYLAGLRIAEVGHSKLERGDTVMKDHQFQFITKEH